ncbi:hypothetical protein FJ250_02005 [bacterium]|nr:hypothetical protein [bacterium]
MLRQSALWVSLGVCFVLLACLANPAAAAKPHTAANPIAGADPAAGARLDRAVKGAAGTVLSVAYARDLAPERHDLAKHAAVGGAISTVVGALGNSRLGWQAGVAVGAGKELVNDALLGRGCPQLDDFLVTASAAIFAGSLSSRLAPLVYVDGHGAEVRFSLAF